MSEYTVRWEIEVTADSPKEAAEAARETQLDENSEALYFIVSDFDGEGTGIYVEL